MSALLEREHAVVTADPRLIRRAIASYLQRDEPVYLDTETTGLDPHSNKLVMVQLYQASGKLPLIIDYRALNHEAKASILPDLQTLFTERMLVGHNLKFDLEFLLAQGLEARRVYDTMLVEQLLDQDEVSLAATLKRRFQADMSKMERTWFYQPAPLDERPTEWQAPFPAEEVAYAALDVTCLPELFHAQRADLLRCGLRRVAYIEMRALPAIAKMELRGIRVEPVGWRAFIQEQADIAREATNSALLTLGPLIMRERIATFDAQLAEWQKQRDLREHTLEVGKGEWGDQPGWGEERKRLLATVPVPPKPKLDIEPPNIGSQKQLITGLKALGIQVPTKKNEKGEVKETTDSDNLERLVGKHEVIRHILDARKAQKFVDAFGEKLLSFMDERERIHPDYHQIGADTGRMSCSKPNWQQVPARGDGVALRKCVIAGDGMKLITADFSNIELRIIADLSGDPKMLEMFASGEDLHSYTARLMFDLSADIDPKHTEWRGGLTYRQAAKIVNYLIPYGGSAYAIAQQNNMPVEDAEQLVAKWFGMFSGVNKWMEGLKRQVRKDLKSVTLSGRTRIYRKPEEVRGTKTAAELFAAKREYQKQWKSIERQARNSPVQGLSADITKLAVALFHERNASPDTGLVAVVHDELVVEAPEAYADEAAYDLALAMDQAAHEFLQVVSLPFPEPTISDHWEHE